MADLIAVFNRLDASPLVALLLLALSAALRQIGKGLANRLDCAEARIEELEARQHHHDMALAIIRTRLDIQEETNRLT